jgi:protoporphyrin/coproporphyrin ferrochelatase
MNLPYDAFLLVSFGGPEGRDDVLPFLENVLDGKPVPRWRLLQIAEKYEPFQGVSPINEHNRTLLKAIESEFRDHGLTLPLYWGNRHWHPMLADALRRMASDGVRRALAFVTSAFGSYPGCRQYLEAIQRARLEVGEQAPQVDKLRLFFNHPGFIEPMGLSAINALQEVPAERREAARLVFTAHSLPRAIARKSEYRSQLREACQLVAAAAGREDWDLVYQSRSGKPDEPWLGPDISEHIRALVAGAAVEMDASKMDESGEIPTPRSAPRDIVVVPIGFLQEHIEIIYDLDVEARGVCEELGLNMVRAKTVDCHPRFVSMIRELVVERIDPGAARLAIGSMAPGPDCCPPECCK